MNYFDVFNGDADGICSLHQLRLAQPLDACLITGTKRDISLLERIPEGKGNVIAVFDISMDVNRDALQKLLDTGSRIEYFDHHGSGQVLQHRNLQSHIDISPHACTGLIVDRYLAGQYSNWAVAAAFGDNLQQKAFELSARIGLASERTAMLRELGESLNYNGYGDTEEDLIIHPAALYEMIKRYQDPFDFIHNEPIVEHIHAMRRLDMEMVRKVTPRFSSSLAEVVILPDTSWSRRVRGTYSNLLANASPQKAHAVLSCRRQGGYAVSVRAPLATLQGARTLCERFKTGGGRAAAAGINFLPDSQLSDFIDAFNNAFSGTIP